MYACLGLFSKFIGWKVDFLSKLFVSTDYVTNREMSEFDVKFRFETSCGKKSHQNTNTTK